MSVKNKFLPVSILMMTAALAGIFALQVYWFMQAYELKSRDFDSRVNMALIKTAERIEAYETKNILIEKIGQGVNYFPRYPDSSSATSIPSGTLLDQTNLTIRQPEAEAEATQQKIFLPDGTELTISTNTIGGSLSDSVRAAVQNEARQLFTDILFELELFKREGMQMPDPVKVDSILDYTLGEFGIRSGYKGAVYLPQIDSALLLNHTKSFTPLKESKFYVRLFPQFAFAAPQYLVIDFMDKTASIIAELQSFILLFLLFSTIIIGVYAYTLRNFLKQRKLSELKTDFINNMTHEFKTPIASISLAADSLKNPKILQNPELILHYGEIIKEENKRMNRHIESVLQSAILEKDSLQLNKETLHLHALLETAADRVRFQHGSVEIRIAEEYEAENDKIFGDEMHLVNVFVNLLDNAVKYCKTVPEITIKTQNVDNEIRISFSDNGIGIKKDDIKEIFQKFYRVPTGNLHNVKGFGLGLHYVKSIIEMHGGTVGVESVYGKGSTFTLTLPLITKNEQV
jgi:two-component system phosphate regulon sensor histidine kinase PhoR